MNFIKLFNRLWRLQRITRITGLQADVYFCFVWKSNERNWPENFKIENKLLCFVDQPPLQRQREPYKDL